MYNSEKHASTWPHRQYVYIIYIHTYIHICICITCSISLRLKTPSTSKAILNYNSSWTIRLGAWHFLCKHAETHTHKNTTHTHSSA